MARAKAHSRGRLHHQAPSRRDCGVRVGAGCPFLNGGSNMSEESFKERRKFPRFALISEAEVTGTSGGGPPLQVRISELCAGGCYVDTINPLPASTEILVHIEHGDLTCLLPGKVIYVHEGLGMGVQFGDLPADQRAILDGWIAQMAAPPKE